MHAAADDDRRADAVHLHAAGRNDRDRAPVRAAACGAKGAGCMTRFCVQATWNDVPHLSEAQKASLWEAIPEHQRDARTKGIPILGSGRIFVAPEEKLACEPFDVPRTFVRITG